MMSTFDDNQTISESMASESAAPLALAKPSATTAMSVNNTHAGESPLVNLVDIGIQFGRQTVVDAVNLTFYPGEIACLLGPSGCGKTTILRAIAGFESLAQGCIYLGDQCVSTAEAMMPPERRRIGLVFQDFALFPHLTISQNIAFGLSGMSAVAKQSRVRELLALVDLSDFENRYPHSLSGGQQQRIALARAIAPKPQFLLMDEPFSSLDVDMRTELVPQVREILLKEGIAGLLVTHDQLEAFAMADRIAVMRAGKIEQYDSGYELYHRPSSKFVADFIGQGSFITAAVVDEYCVQTPLGMLKGDELHGFLPDQAVELLIRPDDVIHDDDSTLQGTVMSKRFEGKNFLYRLCVSEDVEVYCHAPSHHDYPIGEQMGVRLVADHLVMFAAGAITADEVAINVDNIEQAHP